MGLWIGWVSTRSNLLVVRPGRLVLFHIQLLIVSLYMIEL